MADKICKQCGCSFEVVVSRGNHRYCAACRQTVRRISHRAATQKYDDKRRDENAKRPKLVACIDCGVEAVLRIGRRKTCETCTNAARLRRYLEYAPQWRAANAERFKKRQADWRTNNQDKIQKYYERDKERGLRRQREHAHRARKIGSGGSFTPGEWNLLLWIFDHHCAYCFKAKELTVDHVIPLERGGSSFIENILPACRTCNTTKRYRTEWRHAPTGELLRVVPLLDTLPGCGLIEAVN